MKKQKKSYNKDMTNNKEKLIKNLERFLLFS
jgi:hypothetical protein